MPISYIMHNKLQFMNFDLIEAQICPALAHFASIRANTECQMSLTCHYTLCNPVAQCH